MRMRPPFARYNGVELPSTDFEAVRDQLRIPYLFYELDLTSSRSIAAGTQLQLPLKGNCFYVDQNTDVGVATVIFCDLSTTAKPGKVYVQPGFNAQIPFDYLTFEHTAQPGKVLRFFYGVDIDFKPGNNNSLTVSGVVSAQDYGLDYGVSWTNVGATVANTPITILAPGSNVNGVVLKAASINGRNAGGPMCAIIAKSSAPATVVDGDVLLSPQNLSDGGIAGGAQLAQPLRVAAGKGLYFISTLALGAAANQESALYTIL